MVFELCLPVVVHQDVLCTGIARFVNSVKEIARSAEVSVHISYLLNVFYVQWYSEAATFCSWNRVSETFLAHWPHGPFCLLMCFTLATKSVCCNNFRTL